MCSRTRCWSRLQPALAHASECYTDIESHHRKKNQNVRSVIRRAKNALAHALCIHSTHNTYIYVARAVFRNKKKKGTIWSKWAITEIEFRNNVYRYGVKRGRPWTSNAIQNQLGGVYAVTERATPLGHRHYAYHLPIRTYICVINCVVCCQHISPTWRRLNVQESYSHSTTSCEGIAFLPQVMVVVILVYIPLIYQLIEAYIGSCRVDHNQITRAIPRESF